MRLVSQFEFCERYSPPRIGAVAAHQENIAKPPLKAQTGWSVQNDHPVRAFLTYTFRSHPQKLNLDRPFAWAVELGHDHTLELTENQLPVDNGEYDTVTEEQAAQM